MLTQEALLSCLPPLAYDRAAPGVQAEVTAAAAVLDEADSQIDLVLDEHQPGKAVLSLPDWERNHGLPDSCAGGVAASVDVRRLNLLERMIGRGNLSRPYYIQKAARLGYPGCTITEYGPMSCADPCDSPVNGIEFVGVWRLNVPVATAVRLMSCDSPCDSALASWGNSNLECAITKRRPAHTKVLFGYPTN